MIKQTSFLLIFLAVVGFGGGSAWAQNCNIQYEAIVKLRAPTLGSYNVWDSIHGEIPTHERFKSAMVLDGGTVLAAGERVYPDKSDQKDILLTEIGRNGRVLWERVHEASGLGEVVKVVGHEKGALVVANITPDKGRAHVWLGVFNRTGDLLSSKIVRDRKHDLRGHDIEPSASGKSYVLATAARDPKDAQPGWTALYRVNRVGAVISDHGFVIGSENAMYDLYPMEDGGYTATGYIHNANGRKTGWIIRVGEDLRMMWQKSYPRGAGAELVAGHGMIKDTFVTVGTALPIGEGRRGAWIMVVDANGGDVVWQRYLTGALHFDGRSVMANDDGLISALIDGQAPGDDSMAREHVRLLTLNPRGVMFSSDEYFNGEAVDAYVLMPSKGAERLMIGETRVAHVVEYEQEEGTAGPVMPDEIVRSAEGWVVAAPGVDPYPDPCRKQKRVMP